MAPRLSAAPLILCLDFCMHTPDESERIGSSHRNTEDSKSPDTGSPRGNTDNSKFQGTDDSESESRSSRTNASDNAEFLASSMRVRSFNWDWEEGGYTLKWADLAKFELWHQTEERLSCIEFVASTSQTGTLYSWWRHFVCGRQESGGESNYEKKHPDRERKLELKKTGCSCYINIKEYHHTPTVLGHYRPEHDHEVGAGNITYTRLSGTTQERIKAMLTQKIDCCEIVSCRNQNSLATDLIHLKVRKICHNAPDGSCDQLIVLKEVNQIARVLNNHRTRLHPDDAIATRLLLEELSKHNGSLIFYKDKQDRAPINSRLPEDAFVLCLQTDFQLNAYREFGNGFIGIDATHNITQYQDLLLFTIIARDRWGHGK